MDISIPVSATPKPLRERGQLELAFERFRGHRLALAGIVVLLALALLSILVPIVSPYDPNKTNLLLIFEPPSLAHPMGTDSLGRDLATRILYGGRVSLAVGVLAVVVAIVLVLGALSWMRTSRIVRATVLSLKGREFIEAARAIGARDREIMLRHLLPNAVAPIIVAATLGVAGAIIAESTLSFLGLGIQKPTSTWGNMLTDATTDMASAPWTAIFPGLAIFLAVVSINFIGDGLRDALDPRHVA